jgi:hypothetical protein
MMKKLLLITAMVAVVVASLSGCSEPQLDPTSATLVDTRLPINTLSRSLDVEMSEAQVSALREPDWVTMETCGYSTPRPWRCKVYHYTVFFSVLFHDAGSAGWRVNSWY